MPVIIGVPREKSPEERRVAVVPDVVKKFKSLGVDFCIERGAGIGSNFQDEDFGAMSLAADSNDVYAKSQIIFKVQPPTLGEIRAMRPHTVVIGFLNPYQDRERAALFLRAKYHEFCR